MRCVAIAEGLYRGFMRLTVRRLLTSDVAAIFINYRASCVMGCLLLYAFC